MSRTFPELTSLEEDFKALGLIDGESSGAAESSEPSLDERTRKVASVKGGSVKAKKVKVGTARQKAQWRKANRKRKGKQKAYRRRNKRKIAKRRAKIAKKMGILGRVKKAVGKFLHRAKGMFAGRRESRQLTARAVVESYFTRANTFGGEAGIASMLEDIRKISAGVTATDQRDVVKAFANLALVAEHLAEQFQALAPEMVDVALNEEFQQVSSVLASLAEDAAALAKGVNEGLSRDELSLDLEGISEAFRNQMSVLIEGLETFSLFNEEECEDDEELDEGDDSEDDDEDEEDDESDDDEDESDDEEDDDEGEE